MAVKSVVQCECTTLLRVAKLRDQTCFWETPTQFLKLQARLGVPHNYGFPCTGCSYSFSEVKAWLTDLATAKLTAVEEIRVQFYHFPARYQTGCTVMVCWLTQGAGRLRAQQRISHSI